MNKLTTFLLCILSTVCNSNKNVCSAQGTQPQGLQVSKSVRSVSDSMGSLEAALNKNNAISIMTQIDHQANADKNGIQLRPTRVTIFGNPKLGTQLMQVNQLAGLDLPQKLIAWEDETGQPWVAYNSSGYLKARHGLTKATAPLNKINGALAKLASVAAGQEIAAPQLTTPKLNEGIVIVQSANDMATTVNKLREAITSAGPLKIMAEVDHSANARSVNLDLDPTFLFIFGNPHLGSPLMQSRQSIGIDLPQKMLVFENHEGVVSVAYNDPAYLAARHGIEGQQKTIATIAKALGKLASVAAVAPQTKK